MADEAVGMLYLVAEILVAFNVNFLVGFVDAAQGIQNVAGNDLGIVGRTPEVGLYTDGMLVLVVLDGIVCMAFVVTMMMVACEES